MKNSVQLIINEVDCYRGNASIISKYATDSAVQHQILLKNGNSLTSIGRMNGVADSGRGERIVKSVDVPVSIIALFEQCNSIKNGMKTTFCDSHEEYEANSVYNVPMEEELKSVVRKIWEIESFGIEFNKFYYHINY